MRFLLVLLVVIMTSVTPVVALSFAERAREKHMTTFGQAREFYDICDQVHGGNDIS